jgi:cell wall-associated NlpC family hydrolase
MIEVIEAVIKDTAARFSDRRLHLFEIRVESGEGGWMALSGKVLEQKNLDVLHHALKERLPGQELDDSGIRVLRQTEPHLLTVATNITSLHAEPSWLAEMLNQNTYGAVVEVLEEQGRWVRVRQMDGYLGWMYHPYLGDSPAPHPNYIVSAPMTLLHIEPNRASALTSRLLGGTGVQVVSTRGDWAEVDAHVWGWVQMKDLRALDSLPRSTELVRAQMMSDAPRWTGVPYLWGGTSAHGIDCSGFAQLIHRLAGIAIPRDADLQFDAGRKVELPFQPGDLLFFGEQGEKRSITHVGICVGGWQMIHSSRSRNGVQVDDVQSVEHLRNSFIGAASFVP